MKDAVIVGAGISGLTSGIVLQRAGIKTRIVAAAMGPATVSGVAAALWEPYAVNPPEKALIWARRAYDVFTQQAADPASGVDEVLSHHVLRGGREPPFWHAIPRSLSVEPARSEWNDPALAYMQFSSFVADMSVYIDYLARLYTDAGGEMEIGPVLQCVEGLFAQAPLVVNCTGLGSREFAGDRSVYPTRGTVLVATPRVTNDSWNDNENPAGLTYIIPRRDCLVLGGTYEPHAEDVQASQADIDGILERCRILVPGIARTDIVAVKTGFRPSRPAVRLEREEYGQGRAVIHNYGHGGGGVTLCWGCADDVLDIYFRTAC